MRKAIPNKTIGPLHAEDLEPHQFEDLIRQLLYDFRLWRQIEATGRSGTDGGFDARAWEAVADSPDPDDGVEQEDPNLDAGILDRPWLIQCKREKSIPPSKLAKYLDEVPTTHDPPLSGLIFAAPSDFSMKARELFRSKVHDLGVAEGYLWGKGEIEDMLFQPRNDHLLFAYFGISLRTRQQTLRTGVRARLAMKRQVKRIIDAKYQPLLLRDGSDDTYPYLNGRSMTGPRTPPWRVFHDGKSKSDGMHLPLRRYMAFIDDDGEGWDFAEKMNDSIVEHVNPWFGAEDQKLIDARRAARDEARQIWEALPEANKAWFEVFGVLPYENIIAIDEDGDEYFQYPHVYTIPFERGRPPFRTYQQQTLECIGRARRRAKANPDKRILKFARPDGS